MLRLISRIFIGTSIVRKRTPSKKRNESSVAQSASDKAVEFNGQLIYVFTKSEHTQVPLLDRSASFMGDIVVTKEGVTKLLKSWNHCKTFWPDEPHPKVLNKLATVLCPICSPFPAVS